MEAIQKVFNVSVKRPFLIIFLAGTSLLFCLVDLYNPFFTLILNMAATMQEGNLSLLMTMDSILGIIKFIFEAQNLVYVFGFLLVSSLTAAIISGMLFSGYFYILNNALKDLPKLAGEYADGLKKNFKKLFFFSFKLILSSGLFILFLLVAIVPAVTSVKAIFTQSAQFTLLSILLSLITLIVTVFACIFFQSSVIFWLPGIINNENNAFRRGKLLADQNFWSIFPKLLKFDFIFLLYGCLYLYAKHLSLIGIVSMNASGILLFILNWVIITFLCFLAFTYVFSAFWEYKYEIADGPQ